MGALIVFFQSLAITGMVGILRAGGDAKFVLICETAFLWGVGGAARLRDGAHPRLARARRLLCLKCDEILKTVVSSFRILGFKWLRDLTVRD